MSKGNLEKLRAEMEKHKVREFLTITSDAHGSEYICERDNAVKFISGFTGTNGTLYVTKKKALLFTDGRYFIQAKKELKGSSIVLMRLGEKSVNKKYDEILSKKGLNSSLVNEPIINAIWVNRPKRPANPIWIHKLRWAGETASEKLAKVRTQMKKEGLKEISVCRLDDIAWVLNLRGSDIPYNPVFYSYLVIGKTISLYVQKKSLSDEVCKYLKKLNVNIYEYADYEGDGKFSDIISRIKTHKSEKEIKHMRESGIRDGVYVTKFIKWIKENASKGITEMDAARYLDKLRSKDDRFISQSFPTISAYGKNAAIVHYEVTEKTNGKIKPRGLYLVDSGAQYLDGTTDVTRTIALGKLTNEEKKHYTLVCIGMLRALNAKYTLPVISTKLDDVARKPLKKNGLDFNHGTGHGIGYLLYVHEDPARINRKGYSKKPYHFTGGEVVSDEPGVYIENSHGVRIENMVYVSKNGLENLTWVPLEEEAIDFSLMTKLDKKLFDDYQKMVIKKIGRYL